MSISVAFFHETFDGKEWVSERSGRIFGTDPFLWLKTKQCEWTALHALFFHAQALIPFRNGLPPDQSPSRLCEAMARIGGDFRWLPVVDLFLEDWNDLLGFFGPILPIKRLGLGRVDVAA